MTTYDPRFFDLIRQGVVTSAQHVVPLLHRVLHGPVSVVDVGCGEGWWAHRFATDHGCRVLGVDRDADVSRTNIPFRQVDLDQLFPPDLGTFDVALALEVAEHLPPHRANSFIGDLCHLAPVVVFSAAIPGQGGHGHVNEQWPAYWRNTFACYGYACSGALRFELWENPHVENWYAQNLLIATRTPDQYPDLFDTPLAPAWPLVHPILYDARRR
jgi:SAM-dependent methyltransferase